jgi:hypothetical protein
MEVTIFINTNMAVVETFLRWEQNKFHSVTDSEVREGETYLNIQHVTFIRIKF